MNPFAPIKESREQQYANFISHLWNKFVNEPETLTKAGSTELRRAIKLNGFANVRAAKRK